MDKKKGRGRPRKASKREFAVIVLLEEVEAAKFQALCITEGLTASSMGRKLFNMATTAAFAEGK